MLVQRTVILVPCPSGHDVKNSLLERFKASGKVRIKIGCLELFIQKPKIASSQKTELKKHLRLLNCQ